MTDFDMPPSGTWEQRGGWVVRELAKDAGLTLAQAAGLVGNLGYESNGFRTLQEITPLIPGSRGGGGWAQWTAGRRVKFERRCAEKGYSPASDEGNYDFLLHELLGEYRNFASRLRQMRSIEDACRLTHKEYETPSDVLDGSYRSGPDRLKWARRALTGAAIIADDPAGEPIGDAATNEIDAAIRDFESKARTLQIHLKAGRYYSGRVDGDWGPISRAALADYKTRLNPT